MFLKTQPSSPPHLHNGHIIYNSLTPTGGDSHRSLRTKQSQIRYGVLAEDRIAALVNNKQHTSQEEHT